MNIRTTNAKTFRDLIVEAEQGMEPDTIYDTSNMQIIWMQIGRNDNWMNRLKISKDNGSTWEAPPGVDTGKWYYDSWLFKWED